MEDTKSLDPNYDIPNKNINKQNLEIKNKETESITTFNNESNEIMDSKINQNKNSFDSGNDKIIEEKTLENNKRLELTPKLNSNKIISNNNIEKSNNEILKEKTIDENKLALKENNSDTIIDKSVEIINKENKREVAKVNIEENKKALLTVKSDENADQTKNNSKDISKTIPVKAKSKPVKELPIEKKPFLEFVNDHLIPEIKNEFKLKDKEVKKIILQKTNRPIAGDICWVIYCEIYDTCNFWLSFEKDDITSLKSFSLCKNYEKPSIIESFLIDEKKITLKLIISRILQRLNGQKLIGAN